MPLVLSSSYRPPIWLRNGHVATLYPSLFRKVDGVGYDRQRIDTPDGDFLDLDWVQQGARQLVIISHGLEGSSDRPYMKGMAKYFMEMGWDVLAWNCRSCSGEMNLKPTLYHHGATEDIKLVVEYAAKEYEKIALVGFSMGGSMTAKYLGENGRSIPRSVVAGVAFSTPTDLGGSSRALEKSSNRIYMKRFLKKLAAKFELKNQQFPGLFDLEGILEIKSFQEFDERYTAHLYGFKSAEDFYESSRCDQFLDAVEVPLLIVNAANDPFLSDSCYPYSICEKLPNVWLETPRHGGHVGFGCSSAYAWSEQRAFEFVSEVIGGI